MSRILHRCFLTCRAYLALAVLLPGAARAAQPADTIVVLGVRSTTIDATARGQLTSSLREAVQEATPHRVLGEAELTERAGQDAKLGERLDAAHRAFDSAHEAHINLDLGRAVSLYRRALSAQRASAQHCYQVEQVAQTYIQLGAALADNDQAGKADAALRHAARLAPWLMLDPAQHSPSLRARYSHVEQQLGVVLDEPCEGAALRVVQRLSGAQHLVLARVETDSGRQRVRVRVIELASGDRVAEVVSAPASDNPGLLSATASAATQALGLLDSGSEEDPDRSAGTQVSATADSSAQPGEEVEVDSAADPGVSTGQTHVDPDTRMASATSAQHQAGELTIGAAAGVGVSLFEPVMLDVRAVKVALGVRLHPRWTLTLGSGLGVTAATSVAPLDASVGSAALVDLLVWRMPLELEARFDLLDGAIRPQLLLGALLNIIYLSAATPTASSAGASARLINPDSWGVGPGVHAGLGLAVDLSPSWSLSGSASYTYSRHFYAKALRWDVVDTQQIPVSRQSVEATVLQDRHGLTLNLGIEVKL